MPIPRIDINRVLDRYASVAEPQLRNAPFNIHSQFGEHLSRRTAVPQSFTVFMNLILKIARAMPNGLGLDDTHSRVVLAVIDFLTRVSIAPETS